MDTSFITAEWVKKYCKVNIDEENNRWETVTRPKNEGYLNGSHVGYVRALKQLRDFIERVERIKPDNPFVEDILNDK